MSNIAISFEHVSKMYQLGVVGTGTISNDLKRWWAVSVRGKEDPFLKIGQTNDRATKGDSDFVYALRDIDFKVEQGDVVGIIGKNGAGKSTLLKLLSRITAPTSGTIKANGRIASLLEVGTGFHPELTGRENIYMNGTIMGMTKKEISAKLDEIVDFAGVERYVDTPVKRYSSGMQVRLGFAVAAFLEPEILVVDEVLAVGDAEFQKKAIGKMQDVASGQGRTVLFVSHNMASVRALCKSGVVLKNGMVEMMGTAEECVDFYTGSSIEEVVSEIRINNSNRMSSFARDLEITHVKILNDAASIASDEPLEFEISVINITQQQKTCQFSISIFDSADVRVTGYYSTPVNIPQGKDEFKVRLRVSHHDLYKGRYKVTFIIGKRDFADGIRNFDATKPVLSFEVKYVNKSLKTEFVTLEKWWGGVNHCGDLVQALLVE